MLTELEKELPGNRFSSSKVLENPFKVERHCSKKKKR